MAVEQRLDRVEDDLETVKQLLASAARYAESANEGLDRLTVQVDHISEKVDELTTAQSQSQTRLDRLTQTVDQLASSQVRTQARLDQLTERVDQLSNRVDEFVFQAQRLFTQQGQRLERVEGQTETLVAIVQLLNRNYEAQQAQLHELQRSNQEFQRSNQEFQRTTNAALERIDRILDYLLRQQGGNQ